MRRPMEPESLADEILAERVLLGPANLAATAGLADGARGSPEGVPCALYDPAKGEVELPCDGGWDDCNAIVFRVGLREGEGGELQVTVEREGMPRLVSIGGLGRFTRERWKGWRDALYPSENFGLAPGAPFGRVTKLRIRGFYGGPFRLGEVRLRKRRLPRGPRLTDRGFVAAWDWSRPGLEAARRSAERGDLPAMIRGLRAYFQARTLPALPFARRWAWPSSREAADLACRNVIAGRDFGASFHWERAFLEVSESAGLDRHYFLADLLHAWQDTRDPRYAAKLDEFISGWIAASPAPCGHGGKGSRAWSSLTAGCRFKRTWLQVFFSMLGEPAFRDRTWFDMLKAMREHAVFLLRWGSMGGTNWTAIEAHAIALIGIAFPEDRDSAGWREEGLHRLSVEIADSVFPDGIHQELSPGYHISSANAFAAPFEVAAQNGIPTPAIYAERLRAMFRAMAALVRPDGTLPSHNDSGGYLRREETFFREGARLWNDPEMLWLGSGGREGRVPEILSHGFTSAGLLVMRSGWDPQDRWSLFDVGPFGAGHRHEDALGLETYAYGAPFLVDPGVANYNDDAWFRFYRSTAAHNTLMVDGGPQQRGNVETRESWRRDVSKEIFWATSRVLDVGAGVYPGGYRGVEGRFLHRRAVLFLRPDYWVVVDELEGEGRHAVEALWHFAPMEVVAEGARARARRGEAHFEIVPLFARDLSARVVRGQRDPVQGWVAEHPKSLPAPCVLHRWEGELPMRQLWVLAPSWNTPLCPTLRTLRVEEAAVSVEIGFANGARDMLRVHWGGWRRPDSTAERAEAWLTVERFAADGKRRAAAAARGEESALQAGAKAAARIEEF